MTQPARHRPVRVDAVVSDLDGTLLRPDFTISEVTAQTLDRARGAGIHVVCATARNPREVQRIAGYEHLGLMVCGNGAVTWDAARAEVIGRTTFDRQRLATSLRAVRERMPGAAIGVFAEEEPFAERGHKHADRPDVTVVDDVVEVATARDLVGVVVRFPGERSTSFFDELRHAFTGCGVVAISSPSAVNVTPPGVTKASGVAVLCARLEIDPGNAIAFGDMPNDLPLFEWAGYGYAVANADPEVLAAADEVVASHDKDGVATTIASILDERVR